MNDQSEVGREMPRYKCHKIVHALKIESFSASMRDGMTLRFDEKDGCFNQIDIPEAEVKPFLAMRDADAGYLVIYEDGYRSWSPTVAFEEGYTRI